MRVFVCYYSLVVLVLFIKKNIIVFQVFFGIIRFRRINIMLKIVFVRGGSYYD